MFAMLSLRSLLDPQKCYEEVRKIRWPNGVNCPHCHSTHVVKNGHHETEAHRQRYLCKDCAARFDDLTSTVFEGHHQPLEVWMAVLYLMGLNLSNRQIAEELNFCTSVVHEMTSILRQEILDKKQEIKLSQEVEIDEVYLVAGHKGHPEIVKKKVVKDVVEG